MSANKPLIAVIGATGIQGGSVVETFLKDGGLRIRGLTRNPSSNAAKSLSSRGVEVVAANLNDTESLISAFQGSKAIFSVTDFWHPYGDPENLKNVKPGQTINEWVYEYELQQGKNVLDAAAKTRGLERLIFSGLSDVTKWSGGKYRHVYHFDSKAHAEKYGRETYPELWAKTSVIQVGFYTSNYLGNPMTMPKKNSDGVFDFGGLMDGRALCPMIATEEDTGPFVKALLEVPPGKNLYAYRELMSVNDFVTLWGKILGVKTKQSASSYEATIAKFGPHLAEEIWENMAYVSEFGYEGTADETVVHPRDLGYPVNLPTVEDWIKKQDWSAVLNQ